jgi:hypothetical protein
VCSGLTDLAVFILLPMLKSCFDVFQESQQPPQ